MQTTVGEDHLASLAAVRLLLLDVDGVLTQGEVIYNDLGEETKVFNVRDGLGIRLLMNAGILVGIVTGRAAPALRHRCKNLGINLLFDGTCDKKRALAQITEKEGVLASETAFMGDDLADLGIMTSVGVPIAVADAHPEVKKTACIITQKKGGHGAVREVCEAILKIQGLWDSLLEKLKK